MENLKNKSDYLKGAMSAIQFLKDQKNKGIKQWETFDTNVALAQAYFLFQEDIAKENEYLNGYNSIESMLENKEKFMAMYERNNNFYSRKRQIK